MIHCIVHNNAYETLNRRLQLAMAAREHMRLPVLALGDSNLCQGCDGACCRKGMAISLADHERLSLEAAGAKLARLAIPTQAEAEQELRDELGPDADIGKFLIIAPEYPCYLFLQDCPHLVQTTGMMAVCAVYGTDDKPDACTAFEAGAPSCLAVRAERTENL